MKLKKKLKDPNEKSAIQKFVGGKIPHYLAVVAFAWVLVDVVGFGFSVITNAPAKEEQKLQEKITKIVDRELMMRFPQTSGPVLRTQTDNKLWIDFIEENKQNGSNP
jgi:hydrogenase maturation factor